MKHEAEVFVSNTVGTCKERLLLTTQFIVHHHTSICLNCKSNAKFGWKAA